MKNNTFLGVFSNLAFFSVFCFMSRLQNPATSAIFWSMNIDKTPYHFYKCKWIRVKNTCYCCFTYVWYFSWFSTNSTFHLFIKSTFVSQKKIKIMKYHIFTDLYKFVTVDLWPLKKIFYFKIHRWIRPIFLFKKESVGIIQCLRMFYNSY